MAVTMSDSIRRETVEAVARLARIELSPEDVIGYQHDLSQILDYVGQLDEVELLDGIEPFFGISGEANARRDDRIQPSLPRGEVLGNAPDTDGEFYRVPPVFR